MFDDEFLGHVIKVSLAHPLEPISNILLNEFIFFLRQRWKRAILRIIGGC